MHIKVLVLPAFLLGASVLVTFSGCRILVAVDRGRIGSGGGSGSGSGGTGGFTASSSNVGGSGTCIDPTADCPKPTMLCHPWICHHGICETSTAPVGTACDDNGGSVCDEGGQCIGCNGPADCPTPPSQCLNVTCNAHVCGTSTAPIDTVCSDHGGKLCDGAGACVACNVSTECVGYPQYVCDAHACILTSCSDGIKNGLETDVDCGGSLCGACTDGLECAANSDCQSGACADGYCCDQACTGSCLRCNAPGFFGICTVVDLGKPDVDSSCSGTHACDGFGNCLKASGQPCSLNVECASGTCKNNSACQ